MASNQLTGSLPSVLGSLNDLEVLFLNSNQLSGNIPAELGNLSNLVMLWLQDNLLVGDIPSSFINLVNLIDPGYGMDGLDLDYNHLNILPRLP